MSPADSSSPDSLPAYHMPGLRSNRLLQRKDQFDEKGIGIIETALFYVRGAVLRFTIK